MSAIFALVPVAIAVAAAVSERKERVRADALAGVAPEVVLATRMTDSSLLMEALTLLGMEPTRDSDAIRARVDAEPVSFRADAGGRLDAVFAGSASESLADATVAKIDAEYTRLVQQRVYEKVVARAREHGLTFASERVEEDNSIVVTLRVGA
jgi:hypothetical protein